jgi:hypothetical protein
LMSFLNASNPPADAPIPTTKKRFVEGIDSFFTDSLDMRQIP